MEPVANLFLVEAATGFYLGELLEEKLNGEITLSAAIKLLYTPIPQPTKMGGMEIVLCTNFIVMPSSYTIKEPIATGALAEIDPLKTVYEQALKRQRQNQERQ